MTILVKEIYRHPVKGLTPERRDAVSLKPGKAIANDRRFALALGSTPVDGAIGTWMAKTNFLMLARNERMAHLETSFDDETQALTIKRNGRQVARGVLTDQIGRTVIEDFFAAYMGDEARGHPKLVEAADGHVLSDHANAVISIINDASLEDMSRVVGHAPDARRFRGNFIITGLNAWAEFDWVGRKIQVGEAVLEVTTPIDRCAATSVNPDTAERDLNVVKTLQATYGHINCGVFAEVISGGTVHRGDTIEPL